MANEHADQGRFKGRSLRFAIQAYEIEGETRMFSNIRIAALSGAILFGMAAVQAQAAAFAAWQVAGLPFGDTLNVRKYPSGNSQKQGAYPEGTVLQMTGKCTGGVNLLDISGQPDCEAEAGGSLSLVRDLARPGSERQLRHRLGLRTLYQAVLRRIASSCGHSRQNGHNCLSPAVRPVIPNGRRRLETGRPLNDREAEWSQARSR